MRGRPSTALRADSCDRRASHALVSHGPPAPRAPRPRAKGGHVIRTFEILLFASRWLLAPFYIALVAALLELLEKVGVRAYSLTVQFVTDTEEEVILGALGIVDLTLTASLVVLVIFSGYANFVSRVDTDAHPGWPSWMANIDFSELKLRLMASIVAISAIKLLETYMNIEQETDRQLWWQAGVLGVFVASALLLAVADWFTHLAERPPD
jgi:uncharacterized protein (TIGR00645 family)